MVRNNSLLVTIRRRFARTVSHPPVDLLLATLFSGAFLGVIGLDVAVTAGLRAALTLCWLLTMPGYLLVAIGYPAADHRPRPTFQPSLIERVALSFGLSVVLTVLLALVPALVGLEYTTANVLGVVAVAVLVGIPAAAYRRKGVPESEQFRLPIRSLLGRLTRWISSVTLFHGVVRGLLVASVLLASVSFVYVLAVPQDGERYTTMSLLTANETGELATHDYPRTVTVGEPAKMTLAVTNERQRRTAYTVVVRIERTAMVDGQRRLLHAQRVRTFRPTLSSGSTWLRPHAITPPISGDHLRLRYYLYVGSPPENVGPDTAQNYLHLWVDVEGR
jgi:uncharacterized membrane protein